MKIVIFGATGGIGLELLKQAPELGHEVTAVVRNSAKLESSSYPDIRIVQGNALDQTFVEEVVDGHDAVLSAIGSSDKRSTIREESTKTLIAAMEKKNVRRLIALSSLGVGDSRAHVPFFVKYIFIDLLHRRAFADHERQEAVIRQSSIDWTIVRPTYFIEGPRTGDYQHWSSTNSPKLKGKISRADVADFMWKQIDSNSYVHKTPGVSY